MDSSEYLQWLETEGDRFARAVEAGTPDAPVVACPDWTLHDLATHLGSVHRWAATAARTVERPGPIADPDPDEPLAEWYRAGLTEVLEVLRRLDDDAPTWHPFPAPLEAGLWKRRQAHEVTMHRWDAQLAAGLTPDPIDAALASDGLDEFFGMIVPRLVVREGTTTPTASMHVHCTDVPGEWLVSTGDDGYQLRREHAKGDAAVRGPAADLLRFVYGRSDPAPAVDIVGDEAAVTAWCSLPGF